MTQELYINAKRVDLQVGTKLTLNFRSNIFGAIDKLTSGYSLTIKLPKTPNNDAVLGMPDVASVSSETMAYKYYNAYLIIDGVPIVNGKAVLLSASTDNYDVSLIWGAVAPLQEWLDSDKVIGDLDLGDDNVGVIKEYYNNNNYDIFDKTLGKNIGLYYYFNGDGDFVFPVVKVGFLFRSLLDNELGGIINTSGINLSALDSLYITFTKDLKKETDASSNDRLFLVKDNLPEIKQVDFFKAVCIMQGWFVEQDASGNVKLLAIDTLRPNVFNSRNWSNKFAQQGDPEVDFSYNDNAKYNWMRYKEDKSVVVDSDGYVRVEDAVAEVSKTLYTLPFAATEGRTIKQYNVSLESVEIVDNPYSDLPRIEVTKNYEFIRIEPRILELTTSYGSPTDASGNKIPQLYFTDELKFSSVIANKYSYYQEIVRQPKVVTVELNLSVFDYVALDYTKPIYLSQYGSYFAIIELRYSDDRTTAKLIKLP